MYYSKNIDFQFKNIVKHYLINDNFFENNNKKGHFADKINSFNRITSTPQLHLLKNDNATFGS